jgi:3-hydroxyacyl-CoA dehydrogenase/enoyl-CoA hydratase/3-hydroxybutyryl-CoA epimerase
MNIFTHFEAGGICTLTLDRADSPTNLIDHATLAELEQHLAAIEKDSTLRGVLITSAKPAGFVAGADWHAFANGATERALSDWVNNGHRILTRLSRLRIPTVAAIHGPCLGGGLELALACDWRVAANDTATRFGLPETQLGIIPTWGGSTRLPKLIGLAPALDLIVEARTADAASALALGLIDDAVAREALRPAAVKLLARGKRPALPPRFANRWPFAHFAAAKARGAAQALARQGNPAPLRAVEVCTAAAHKTLDEGLAHEKHAFLELVRTPQTRALMSRAQPAAAAA